MNGSPVPISGEDVWKHPLSKYFSLATLQQNEHKYVRVTVLYFCWIGPNIVTIALKS